MPKKDHYHDEFCAALRKDGWTITHDPLYYFITGKRIYIDVAAYRAEQPHEIADRNIAVEIKSFVAVNDASEFEKALGQFSIYKSALKLVTDDRELWLALPHFFYEDLLETKLYLDTVKNLKVHIVVYNPAEKTIVQWIK